MEYEKCFIANRNYGETIPRARSKRAYVIPDEYVEEILEMLENGMTYAELGRKNCCSAQCIKDSVERYKKKHKPIFF